MPNIFTLIGSSYEFYRTHPVLNAVLLWFFVVPNMARDILTRLVLSEAYLPGFSERALLDTQGSGAFILFLLGSLTVEIIGTWGIAAVLVSGKRMLQSKAGRKQSSFATLQREAQKYVLPLVLTGILYSCFTIFWMLLLIIPGIIYAIRAGFYNIVIVHEDLDYREALNRSIAVVKGHTSSIFLYFLGFTAIGFFVGLIVGTINIVLIEIHSNLFVLADLITNLAVSFMIILITLSTVLLWGHLLDLSKAKS